MVFIRKSIHDFSKMMEMDRIILPKNLNVNLDKEALVLMATAALNFVLFWQNCLGLDWQKEMTRERYLELYRRR
jgi:hypothetical protein